MKNLKLTLLTLCVLLTALISCSNDDDQTKVVQTDNPLVSNTDKLVDDHFRPFIEYTKYIGLSVAVIDGDTTSFYNYGDTYKGNNTLPTENSTYEIGSNTKTFSAAVLTKLMLENGISEDTPISELLPEEIDPLNYQGNEIKVKHLLNHTSGLPRIALDMDSYDDFNINDPYAHYGFDKLINFLNHYELTRMPGTEYEYSNLGYALLNVIVLNQTEQPLAYHIEEFTNLLNMDNTFMTNNYPIGDNSTGGYDNNGNEGNIYTWGIWDAVGGLSSNLIDLEKYVKIHFRSYDDNSEVKQIVEIITTETFNNGVFGVGRAWHIVTPNNHLILNHTGGTGGYTSVILIEPTSEKAIVVLSNNAFIGDILQEKSIDFFDTFLNN
ncbi:MAG: beta-lactamase family protein [Altibacter sp.]|uniref:serine hydrolase domain-containing protein n=1 Tax=Altibacter sp. TaxID=2024823 RepID=UPI001E16E531|nr:serine hydrolase domain-containing protein [Altibacter sp.]MBZ0326123.1 beta-lactamase family protein [Altibacter sp.]